jgi:TolB-like protein/Tfp pilus assembly protein PilF
MDEFLQRLRERKLVQWALAYVAAAFALIQVVDFVAQRFAWPDSVERIMLIALAIGFFVVLVLAWYHGERGAQRVSGTELVILALLLAIGGAILWRFAPGAAAPSAASTAASAAQPASAAATPASAKSIAVLPFENLSADKDNEYFASGMQDMILTKLAAIADLKVISRTSTQKYTSHPDNLRIVAQQLGVATILEGSVQKAGNSVLINVQLIDAGSDAHLWAEAYPRTLENIFGVEGEVAQKVADALKAKLTPTESATVASVPTRNPEAYDLYLHANAQLHRASEASALVPKVMPLAIGLYQQALAIDPGFALAAAELTQAHMTMYWFAPDHTAERLAMAKAAADQALRLQPDLGAAHFALGLYWYWGHRDYAQALQQLELARKAAPNDAQVAQYFAAIDRRQGRWDDAIATYRRATTLDPRSGLLFSQLAFTYACVRRYADADRAYAQAAAVAGDPIYERINQALNGVFWKGDLAPLRAALGSLTPGSDDYASNASFLYLLAWWSRDYTAAIAIAQTDTAANWGDNGNVTLPRALYLAMAYQANGDAGKARPIYVDVRAQMQAALRQRPDDSDVHLALGFVASGLELKDEAIREGRKATELMPVSRDHFSAPGYLAWLARLYVSVGDNDQAIATLQQVIALPFSGIVISPALLKVDPAWDPLRKDARFQKLIDDGNKPVATKS